MTSPGTIPAVTALTIDLLRTFDVPEAISQVLHILWLPSKVGIIGILPVGRLAKRHQLMWLQTHNGFVSARIQTQARVISSWPLCCVMQTTTSLGRPCSGLGGLTIFRSPARECYYFFSGLESLEGSGVDLGWSPRMLGFRHSGSRG